MPSPCHTCDRSKLCECGELKVHVIVSEKNPVPYAFVPQMWCLSLLPRRIEAGYIRSPQMKAFYKTCLYD
jgi:hypothetical protein